jgi:hypothetical protein
MAHLNQEVQLNFAIAPPHAYKPMVGVIIPNKPCFDASNQLSRTGGTASTDIESEILVFVGSCVREHQQLR